MRRPAGALSKLTAAYMSGPQSRRRKSSGEDAVNLTPSKSPRRYRVADPAASPSGLTLTTRTQLVRTGSPSTGRTNRPGHSPTPSAESTGPNVLRYVQLLRSSDRQQITCRATASTATITQHPDPSAVRERENL